MLDSLRQPLFVVALLSDSNRKLQFWDALYRIQKSAGAEPRHARSVTDEKQSVHSTRASKEEAATRQGEGYPTAGRIHGKDEVMFGSG